MRHYIISTKMGDKVSLEIIKKFFMSGLSTKELYAEAQKGYRDVVEEMRSPDREEALTLAKRRK